MHQLFARQISNQQGHHHSSSEKKNPQYVSIATNFTNSQVITNCNDIFSRINSPFPCSPWTLVHWRLESYSSVGLPACTAARGGGGAPRSGRGAPLLPGQRCLCSRRPEPWAPTPAALREMLSRAVLRTHQPHNVECSRRVVCVQLGMVGPERIWPLGMSIQAV